MKFDTTVLRTGRGLFACGAILIGSVSACGGASGESPAAIGEDVSSERDDAVGSDDTGSQDVASGASDASTDIPPIRDAAMDALSVDTPDASGLVDVASNPGDKPDAPYMDAPSVDGPDAPIPVDVASDDVNNQDASSVVIDTPGDSSMADAWREDVLIDSTVGACSRDDECSAGGQICTSGRCVDRACTPGSVRCAGLSREVCDSRGASLQVIPCGPTQGCREGACVEQLCTPGSSNCAGTSAVRTCTADGFAYGASTACASGQSCMGGSCAVRCGDGVRGAGEGCDDGNTVSGDGCSSTCALEPCNSLDFSGGGRVAVSQTPALDVGTSWSIAYWARPAVTRPDGAVWTNEDSGSVCRSLGIGHYASGGLAFGARVGGCGTEGFAVTTNYFLPMGAWTHIAVVVSGTSAMAYANGAVIHTSTVALIDPSVGTRPFRVGTDGVFGFQGQIADLAMWNRALSPTEISTIRATGVRALPMDPALLIALPADEGSGTTVRDASGRGNTATMIAPARWSTSCPHRLN